MACTLQRPPDLFLLTAALQLRRSLPGTLRGEWLIQGVVRGSLMLSGASGQILDTVVEP